VFWFVRSLVYWLVFTHLRVWRSCKHVRVYRASEDENWSQAKSNVEQQTDTS